MFLNNKLPRNLNFAGVVFVLRQKVREDLSIHFLCCQVVLSKIVVASQTHPEPTLVLHSPGFRMLARVRRSHSSRRK